MSSRLAGRALDIRFEAYGKDIADSVKVNDWIAENILKRPPPHHARYEMFQDKSGGKISKSVGNVLTPQDWLTYASPDSLRLLMFKRIVGARNLSVEDIPTYMDEFDELEEYYFSNTRDPNAMKDARLRGLYEYTVVTKVPDRPGVHIPIQAVGRLGFHGPRRKPPGVRHEAVGSLTERFRRPLPTWPRGLRGRRGGRRT